MPCCRHAAGQLGHCCPGAAAAAVLHTGDTGSAGCAHLQLTSLLQMRGTLPLHLPCSHLRLTGLSGGLHCLSVGATWGTLHRGYTAHGVHCTAPNAPATSPPPQLLAAPLTHQRMLDLASGLEYSSLPLMAIAPSGVLWSSGAADILQGQSCCCCLALLLPCLVAACRFAAAWLLASQRALTMPSCACMPWGWNP